MAHCRFRWLVVVAVAMAVVAALLMQSHGRCLRLQPRLPSRFALGLNYTLLFVPVTLFRFYSADETNPRISSSRMAAEV